MAIPGIRREETDGEASTSFVELFFDLVFVLAITRLSAHLAADLTPLRAAESLFLLLAAWWVWLYTTWMTNWFDPATGPVQAVLLVGGMASMLGAIALPAAFGDRALLFVLGYTGFQTVRNGFAMLATDRADPLHQPLQRLFTWHAAVAVVWLAGALADDGPRIALWIAALALDYAAPIVGHWTPGLGGSSAADWELTPSHFVERIERFLIIALGQSIVAAGMIAAQEELTTARLFAVLVGYGITAALFWLYFGIHAERTLDRLEEAEEERGHIGRDLSYLHIPLIAGIVVVAVGGQIVISDPSANLPLAELVAVGAGPVLYLLGSALFKARVLRMPSAQRVVAAVLIAGVAALGSTLLPALGVWALTLVSLAAVALYEAFRQ